MGRPGWADVAAKQVGGGARALAPRTRRAIGAGLLALSAVATSDTAAYAQVAAASNSCAPDRSPAAASSPAEQVAALYQSFECHFARKEYAACLPYLERACQLTDSPRCLLNLGAVHHALMHCQLARNYYQQFIDRAPYDEDVPAARSALEELERACPQSSAPAATFAEPIDPTLGVAPAVPAPAPLAQPTDGAPVRAPAHAARASSGGPDHLLAWTLLGAGAASLTATVVLAAYGSRAERDYEARARLLEPSARRSDAELRAIDERGERSNQLALALGVVSGLLAGAGATLWLKDAWLTEDEQTESGVSLTIAPDGSALSTYRGHF